MLTAKHARKIASNGHDDYCPTLKSIDSHIRAMAALGFSNTGFNVPRAKAKLFLSRLKAKGYRAFIDEVYLSSEESAAIDVEWM